MLLGRWYWDTVRREARRLIERGYLLELDERRVDWALAVLTVDKEPAAVAHLEAWMGAGADRPCRRHAWVTLGNAVSRPT